jgi:hypothetical protein
MRSLILAIKVCIVVKTTRLNANGKFLVIARCQRLPTTHRSKDAETLGKKEDQYQISRPQNSIAIFNSNISRMNLAHPVLLPAHRSSVYSKGQYASHQTIPLHPVQQQGWQ